MDLGIEGKVALVTGGARGLGASISLGLLREGAFVIATSRRATTLNSFEANLSNEHSKRFGGIVTELSRETAPIVFEKAIDCFGQVDILVNNAGDTLGVTNHLCSVDDWDAVLELNALVPIELARRFIPRMCEQNWGRIVNITSVAGQENSGPVTFSGAKALLSAYSRSMGRVLALEAENVVMSAVFPGVVATQGGHWDKILKENPERAKKYLNERVPARRFGTEKEVADTVLFFCSSLVSFSHGAIVPVDGGHSKHYQAQNFLD